MTECLSAKNIPMTSEQRDRIFAPRDVPVLEQSPEAILRQSGIAEEIKQAQEYRSGLKVKDVSVDVTFEEN